MLKYVGMISMYMHKEVLNMKTFLMIVEIIVSLGLIASVLLQSGRSAGFSGAITGGAEQLMGNKARGMDVIFRKITAACAVLFIVLAIVLVGINKCKT